MTQVQTTIAHRPFSISSTQVERTIQDALPEPLDDHFVVVAGRRFPPKQVISLVTGLDRADFNTHQARHILSRLGFTVGRRALGHATSTPSSLEAVVPTSTSRGADRLRPFLGQWVAERDNEVLVAADTPEAVLSWLERFNQTADAMFRVPLDEREASGIAPA